jgi:hypothetical protein
MRYIINSSDINKFNFCPFCGSNTVLIFRGDYMGYSNCLNLDCEDEIEFIILEEFRDRYPNEFNRLIKKSNR